jgi:two-component system OmpR family response regulator
MKILLCEDDHNIATISRLSLEQIGQHEVTWVTDGEAALEKGLAGVFDVILLDDMMPKMSGVAVCEAFVKSGRPVAPVIFMSANPQGQRVEQFKPLTIGAIPKPFDPMSLNQQIADLLANRVKKAA